MLQFEWSMKRFIYIAVTLFFTLTSCGEYAKVLKTEDQWYGMTYKEDLVDVKNALNDKMLEGIYPAKLWN